MLKFKTHLNEAAFSSSKIEKVVKKLQKVLTKKLGSKLYRYGGPTGTLELKGKPGKILSHLFFMKNKRAFQLNWYKAKGMKTVGIANIDVWRQYKFDAEPDFRIELGGQNIVQVINTVASIIKQPKLGTIAINEDLLLEKRRVSHEEFAGMAREVYGKDDDLTRQEIMALSDKMNVNIPRGVLSKDNTIRRGRFRIMGPGATSSQGRESSLLVIARGQDGKFFNPQLPSDAKKIASQIGQQLTQGPSDRELLDPDTLFGQMKKLVTIVAKGLSPSLFIYGGPGTGKTFVVKKTLGEVGLQKNRDFVMVKGKVSTMGLYMTLFVNRKNKLIVFDDADSAFGDQDSANILKGALDSDKDRTISWISKGTKNVGAMTDADKAEYQSKVDLAMASGTADKVKLPSEFDFRGRVIFISNLNESKVDSAILSRSFKIDMTLTPEQMFKRMESLLPVLGDSDISLEKREEIVKVLRKKNALGTLSSPNMRTFVAASQIVKSGFEDWEDLLQFT